MGPAIHSGPLSDGAESMQMTYSLRILLKSRQMVERSTLGVMSILKPKDDSVARSVDNVAREQNIARMRKTHFSGIMNCVGGDSDADYQEHMNDGARDSFTVSVLREAVKLIAINETPGADKTPAEVLKYAMNSLLSALAHFSTGCLKSQY